MDMVSLAEDLATLAVLATQMCNVVHLVIAVFPSTEISAWEIVEQQHLTMHSSNTIGVLVQD